MRPDDDDDCPQYVESVLELWRRHLDTKQIAETLRRQEWVIERWLHVGLDRQYMARRAPLD